MAPVAEQGHCGDLGFDAFGHQLQAERFGERDDRSHDREITWIGTEFTDEALVDLEGVHRQRLQVRQSAVSGAEVVDGDADTGLLEAPEGDPGGLDVLHHHALGDLQAHGPLVEAELVDDTGHRLHETVRDQLHG